MTHPSPRRRLRPLALLALLLVGCTASAPALDGLATVAPVDPAAPLHVVVLHTNDVHGQVLPRPARWLGEDDPPLSGGLPRVAAYVERTRRELESSGTELLVLDAGDWSQGTPEGAIERGRPFVHALGRIGYDALCLGNHELDHGLPALEELLAELELPITTANVVRVEDDRRIGDLPPWIDLEVGGFRVAVVGLLTAETAKITHVDARERLRFEDPVEILERIRAVRGDVDWFLPITHLGLDADLELARATGVPLVVGGHSHRFLREGVRVGDSLVVQAGCKASVVGRVDLWLDRESGAVLRSEARLVDLLEEPAEDLVDDELAAGCAALVEESRRRMDEVVGALDGELWRSHDALTSSPAGNLIADVTRAVFGADVGLMNRGGIRTDLAAGDVTRRDLFEICPFDNSTASFELTGAELLELVRRSVEDEQHSGVELSGATPIVRRERELVGLRVGGEPVEPGRLYTVAMNSFMASGGDGYLPVEAAAPLEDPRLLRELLEEHFAALGRVPVDATNRYEVVE